MEVEVEVEIEMEEDMEMREILMSGQTPNG